jgi:DNA-directed RNA polymerase subunit RPC12/RpoP
MEDMSCIILPDFTGQEVEEFLGILYLAHREGAASLGPLFTCLIEGASYLSATSTAHKVDSIVKAEKKADKISAEIKMEEAADMKIKKKIENIGTVQNSISEAEVESGAQLLSEPLDAVQSRPVVAAWTSEDGGAFKCSTCGKGFRVRRVLSMHEQIHREPRLACPEPFCTRRFRKRFNLKASGRLAPLIIARYRYSLKKILETLAVKINFAPVSYRYI